MIAPCQREAGSRFFRKTTSLLFDEIDLVSGTCPTLDMMGVPSLGHKFTNLIAIQFHFSMTHLEAIIGTTAWQAIFRAKRSFVLPGNLIQISKINHGGDYHYVTRTCPSVVAAQTRYHSDSVYRQYGGKSLPQAKTQTRQSQLRNYFHMFIWIDVWRCQFTSSSATTAPITEGNRRSIANRRKLYVWCTSAMIDWDNEGSIFIAKGVAAIMA